MSVANGVVESTVEPTTLADVALYACATEAERALLELDMGQCVDAEGISPEEYLAALDAWEGNAASYLAENATEAAQRDTLDNIPAPEQAPAPTSTLAVANATLALFGAEVRKQADQNYTLAKLAYQYLTEFQGASPGKAQRSTAVAILGDEWAKWSEESLSTDPATLRRRMVERANMLIRCHAVATLLGDGSGHPKGDGTRKGRGKGQVTGRLAWGTLRELAPLVSRDDNEYAERWCVLLSVAEDAKRLVPEIAISGLARADVVATVARLMLRDATLELAAARKDGEASRIKRAEEAVERWGGKIERHEAKKPAPATVAPAVQPASPAQPVATPATLVAPPADEPDGEDEPTVPEQQDCRARHLLGAPGEMTWQQAAEWALELIEGCEAPDDACARLLALLAESKELAKGTRAILHPVAFALAEDEDEPTTQEAAQTALASLKQPIPDDEAA